MSDLVRELRKEQIRLAVYGYGGAEIITQAADLIEQQQREIEEKADAYNILCDSYCKLEFERDALADSMRHSMPPKGESDEY